MTVERAHLDGRLTERPDDKGRFDELVGGPVHVHLEMMDDGCLWMSLGESDGAEDRVVIWVRAEKGRKLSVRLF